MRYDPRFLRFARLSGIDQHFNQRGLKKIEAAFLAALMADKAGATFDKPDLCGTAKAVPHDAPEELD